MTDTLQLLAVQNSAAAPLLLYIQRLVASRSIVRYKWSKDERWTLDPDIPMVDGTGGYGKFRGPQVVTYNANNTFNGDVVDEVAVHLSAPLLPVK
jgi:hypothetical protein